MGHLELEVKILDIDVENVRMKIENLGGTFIQSVEQQLYTYDLPTICGRYRELLYEILHPESGIKYMTALDKMKNLLFELDNLMNNEERKQMNSILSVDNWKDIFQGKTMLEKLSCKEMLDFVEKFQINPNKWIRLRKTNNKITLATKHILANNDTNLQQMLETEIEVSSFEGANDLLIQLGYYFKSYQEKKRLSYRLWDHQIDLDTWPGIPTYMEIEGNSEEDLNNILEKLGFSISDAISCTADEVYRIYGKSMFDSRELKFE